MVDTKISAFMIILILFLNQVESGIILNKVENLAGRAKCRLHKIGNVIVHHDHGSDPCETNEKNNQQQVGINQNNLDYSTYTKAGGQNSGGNQHNLDYSQSGQNSGGNQNNLDHSAYPQSSTNQNGKNNYQEFGMNQNNWDSFQNGYKSNLGNEKSSTSHPKIDVRGNQDMSNTNSEIELNQPTTIKIETTSGGRRLIAAGANCGNGQVADQNGICREDYSR